MRSFKDIEAVFSRHGIDLKEAMRAHKITTEDILGNKEISSTTFKGLPNDVKAGDTLLIDDGKVTLRVLETDGVRVKTQVVVPGPVSLMNVYAG